MSDPAHEFMSACRERVDGVLAGLETRQDPPSLYDPVRFVLEAPGKRVRALLTLASASLFDAPDEDALSVAVAMEVFHAFTLVHDDIMDGASERRGRAAVHVKWDAPTAILCGDYLMGVSMELITGIDSPRRPAIMRRFLETVRLLCEGQVRDMQFEREMDVSIIAYMQMIEQKTAALLQTSVVLGGVLGDASAEDCQHLNGYGEHLGLAFQIQDDLLDVTAEEPAWGKPVGGDLISGKRTWLLLRALEVTAGEAHAWFRRILAHGLDPEHLPEAQNRLSDAGVLDAAQKAVIFHSEAARKHIRCLPACTERDVLHELTVQLERRVH